MMQKAVKLLLKQVQVIPLLKMNILYPKCLRPEILQISDFS